VTKPQQILLAANRALADQSNEAAVTEVSSVIIPTIDVLSLSERLFVLSVTHTMAGVAFLTFRHGPVPRGELWTYLEMGMLGGNVAEEWHQTIKYTPTGAAERDIHIQNVLIGTNMVHPVSLLRNLESLGAAAGGYNSARPLVLFPGQTMFLESNTTIAAGQTVRLDANYKISDAPQETFENNNNAANFSIVETP